MLYGPSGGGDLVLGHPVILIQIGFFFHYRTRFYLKTVKGTKKVWNFQGMGNPPKPTLTLFLTACVAPIISRGGVILTQQL